MQIALLLESNGKRYLPLQDHKFLKVIKWPVIQYLSAAQPSAFSSLVKDVRLPLLEAASPSREISLDIAGYDQDFLESGYRALV